MVVVSLNLVACSPDLVGTAATGAAIKKQELEQAQATKLQANEQLQQTQELMKQRNEQLEQNSR